MLPTSTKGHHHHHHNTSFFSSLRLGVMLRLILLWLVIICTLVTIYILLFTNMQQRSKNLKGVPDPIKVLMENNNLFRSSHKSKLAALQNITDPFAASFVMVEKEEDDDDEEEEEEAKETANNPPEKYSRYAYVTLLHGIDESFAYRGYLYNCIIMKESLKRLGSTMDFVVLVGFINSNQLFRTNNLTKVIKQDLELLKFYGIKLFYLPRLHNADSLQSYFHSHSISSSMQSSIIHKFQTKVNFLEMALLKITPWNFTNYEKVQYMDGDILPHMNMDCLFTLNRNTFNTGTASPVNSGWYLAITNQTDYQRMKEITIIRYIQKWDEITGWGKKLPSTISYRGQDRIVKKWEFNGASLDQGLITFYFVLHEGRIQLLDTKTILLFDPNYQKTIVQGFDSVLTSCQSQEGGAGGKIKTPMDMFYHYTGRNKPWLQNLAKPKDKSIKMWKDILDSLKLSVNSSTINGNLLKPPLGFFHPNK